MVNKWGQEAVLDLDLRAWRSGRADLAYMNVWGEKRSKKKSWADSVSRCYPVELPYTGIIIHHSAVLAPDSEHNLDSRGKKILEQLATNLVLQCTCIQYLPPALGLFFPSLSSLLILLLFSHFSSKILSQRVWKRGKKKVGFVGRVWQRVPKSTLSFSFGKVASKFVWSLLSDPGVLQREHRNPSPFCVFKKITNSPVKWYSKLSTLISCVKRVVIRELVWFVTVLVCISRFPSL